MTRAAIVSGGRPAPSSPPRYRAHSPVLMPISRCCASGAQWPPCSATTCRRTCSQTGSESTSTPSRSNTTASIMRPPCPLAPQPSTQSGLFPGDKPLTAELTGSRNRAVRDRHTRPGVAAPGAGRSEAGEAVGDLGGGEAEVRERVTVGRSAAARMLGVHGPHGVCGLAGERQAEVAVDRLRGADRVRDELLVVHVVEPRRVVRRARGGEGLHAAGPQLELVAADHLAGERV